MFKELIPSIPYEYRERFDERVAATAVDFFKIGSVLLTVCFAFEAITQFGATRVHYFYIPAVLGLYHLGLALILLRRPSAVPRPIGLWQLLSGLSPFLLTTLHLQTAAPQDVAGYMAIELVGLCFFIPFLGFGAVGACFVACVMAFSLTGDPPTSVDTIAFLIPTFTLAAFIFVARHHSLRSVFLREIEKDAVTEELWLAKLALDQTSHFVLRINDGGQIEYGNESLCSALNYSHEELVRHRLFDISPDWTAEQWEGFTDSLRIKRSDRCEMKLRTQGGADFLVDMQFDYLEVRESSSQIHGVICGVGVDLTERKWMEDEIQRVQKLEGLETLAGGIAHDYNNLLVPIVINASMMLRQLPAESPSRRQLEEIIAASESATNLTQQLLIYTGVGTAEAIQISITDELNSIADLIKTSLPKNASLTLLTGDEIPFVMAESSQMQRVFLNLAMNAGQALEERGGNLRIQVGTRDFTEEEARQLEPPMRRPAGEYVTCEFADNGGGMSPDVRRRMFDPFFTNKPDGRGLGLSAVLGIMRNHNGGILVDSALGIGTSIQICLPASAKVPAENVVRDESNDQSSRLQRSREFSILIADDDRPIRLAMKKVLEREGHSVHVACSGNEAVEICKKSPGKIDLVLLDHRMPGPGIVETVAEIRKTHAAIAIVACSGFASDLPTELLSGPNKLETVLGKPFNIGELLSLVQTTIDSQPILRADPPSRSGPTPAGNPPSESSASKFAKKRDRSS